MKTVLRASALCFCAASVALAAAPGPPSVHISPTTVAIVHGETAGSFTIRNDAKDAVAFAATAFGWRNTAAGEMQLDPTDDLVVFPTRITIAPGETRRVRLGTRVTAGATERAFRIILEQVPTTPGAGGVEMRMRFNLPVFVQPQKRTASVDLQSVALSNGQARMTLANVSGLHLTPRSVQVTGRDASGTVAWQRSFSPWYLLAGERRDHTTAVAAAECARTSTVEAEVIFLEGNGLTLKKQAPVAAGACQGR